MSPYLKSAESLISKDLLKLGPYILSKSARLYEIYVKIGINLLDIPEEKLHPALLNHAKKLGDAISGAPEHF